MPFVLVGGFAVLTFWLGQVGRLALLPGEDASPGHDPDYIVENFKASAFDASGSLRHVLTGTRLIHYMDDDTAEIDAPRFAQHAPGQPSVTVTARRAVVMPGGSNVHLHEAVQLRREPIGDQAALVLDTDYLHVMPDARRMQTDRGVTVQQGKSSIQARAMRGEDGQITFSGQVRSRYEAP